MDKIIPYLMGLLSLTITIILISDWISLSHLEKTHEALQQTQKQTENILSSRLVKIQKENSIAAPLLINESEATYKLIAICDSFSIFIKKIALKKALTKTAESFEISLELLGEYRNFIDLIVKLMELPWNTTVKTLHIAKEKNPDYPLKIKLDLNISHHCLPQAKQHSLIQTEHKELATLSPFSISRHAGNIVINLKSTELIEIGEAQNVLLLRKPVLD
jgi:hypothetical protein